MSLDAALDRMLGEHIDDATPESYKQPEPPRPLTRAELRERTVVSVVEAGAVLGVGRDVAYALARNGTIPTLAVGARRKVVPVAKLLALLGEA